MSWNQDLSPGSISGGEMPDTDDFVLHRIRNMWQFANLCQWIYIFGKAVGIGDDVDVEMIESACLQPTTQLFEDIGLALLRCISSQRAVSYDVFDELARRQYVSRAPEINPFGTDEGPARFSEFDVFTKIRVLQQLTQWIMVHPDRIRQKMGEPQSDEQASWRIEPFGWDRQDRTYFVLDDNRLYQLSSCPDQSHPKKKKKHAGRGGNRLTTRRLRSSPSNRADPDSPAMTPQRIACSEDDGLGGVKWKCVAVSLAEAEQFSSSLKRTHDENEKILLRRLQHHLIPILQQQEELKRRQALQQERDLINMAKLANAKRSRRIADRKERATIAKLEMDAKLKLQEDEERARAKVPKQNEQSLSGPSATSISTHITRHDRLLHREARRQQHQAKTSEDTREFGTDRVHRPEERQSLPGAADGKPATEEAEGWMFDCPCGAYGQVDNGAHSIACETCNVWQHTLCAGILQDLAEHPDFHFICRSCQNEKSTGKGPDGNTDPEEKTEGNHSMSEDPAPQYSTNNTVLQCQSDIAGVPSVPAQSHDTPLALRRQEHLDDNSTARLTVIPWP